MLISIAYMLLLGMFLGWICKLIKFPPLFGMIITGIILGPHMCDLIDDSILNISAELRRIALIIILIRAGLSLNITDLKKIGRPAIMMCFVPACFEMVGMILVAPVLLGITRLEAAVLGAVIAAVSPAVIVPKMIKLIEDEQGTDKHIPQLILAGASVDDVFVIVMFQAFTSMAKGDGVEASQFINIPLSIIVGAMVGALIGWLMSIYFAKIHIRDTVKVAIILCVSFILVTLEDINKTIIPFAALIAVMCVGISIKTNRAVVAKRLSVKFNKLWVVAEIILFVLVGAILDIESIKTAGVNVIALIFIVLLFRMVGVLVCLIRTKLVAKERIFCMFAYMPKATVQAAIGSVPLSMGLACGNTVLTVAVMAILITAPLGAILIDATGGRCLNKKTRIGEEQ